MKKIEAYIRPEKLDMTKDAIEEQGCEGMSIYEVKGHGNQKGITEVFKGRKYKVDLLPKIKMEIVVADENVDKIVRAIIAASQTGSIGDGKIFVSDISNAYRIRTGEQGDVAI